MTSLNSVNDVVCILCELVPDHLFFVVVHSLSPFKYYLTVSCQLSVLLSAVGVGLPYSLHRTFHVLPSRPLYGAGARLKFIFQGARRPVYVCLAGLSVMQGNLLWSVFVPLLLLYSLQHLALRLSIVFFKFFLIFFRRFFVPCFFQVHPYSITRKTICQY